MLFSSISFLYYFLPPTILLYFAVPKPLKNTVLLLMSLLFYAWGGPKYVLLMLSSILIGYVSGLVLEKARNSRAAKFVLVIFVTAELSLLVYFKYADFFLSNFNAATGLSIPLLKLVLPIGISFYTFQVLSYTVDVYRGEVPAQRNLISLAMYVALFPQLIAGPIVRYRDIQKQLKEREVTVERFYGGLQRFLYGLAKKVLLANQLGLFCDLFRSADTHTVLFYWGYAVAFTLHIYFDFSGYSDMAIGLGRLFGFDFRENFNYPYAARSITEFWRRWHMSLGTWFRDYVYIPLGGNRVSVPRHVCNILIVWLLTGFWHGADWNFLLWGLLFAVLLIVEKYAFSRTGEGEFKRLSSKLLCHVYVMFFVILGFVLFNAAGMKGALADLKGMFGLGELRFSDEVTFYYLRSYAVIFLLGILGSLPLAKAMVRRVGETKCGAAVLSVLGPITSVLLLLVSTAYLVDGSFNPFLYFRF